MKQRRRLYHLATGMTVLALVLLCWVWMSLARDSLSHWHWWLLWRRPRELRAGGGIGPELVNTLSMVLLAEVFSIPLALGLAIWLHEFAPRAAWLSLVERILLGFQGIPTVIVGLLVFQVMIGWLAWPLSVGTGTIALSVFNLAQGVVMGRHAIEGVPEALREGSLALGATPMQTVWRMVLPASLGSLVDQLGLSWARLSGEAALLIFTAGVNVGPHWGWFEPGETLAVHLWYVRTEGLMPDRVSIAAGTGLVLVLLTAAAIIVAKVWANRIRRRQQGIQRV
jgi:phosphate transport system permease protein